MYRNQVSMLPIESSSPSQSDFFDPAQPSQGGTLYHLASPHLTPRRPSQRERDRVKNGKVLKVEGELSTLVQGQELTARTHPLGSK